MSRLSGAICPVWKRLPRACAPDSKSPISLFTDVAAGLKDADIIITVTSAVDAVILPEHIKPGAVVCDVARPRDVSVRVARERDDVLVIEGGVVQVPGDDESAEAATSPISHFSSAFRPTPPTPACPKP